jgi:hypothetical protein
VAAGTRLIGVRRTAWSILGVLAAVVLSGCGDDSTEPAEAADVWTATAQAPLSPRENAVAVTIGDRVLVVGGSDAPPCPPNAECELPEKLPLFDGAIFDPATDRWTRIADAPVPIGGYVDSSTAIVGDTAYFLMEWYVPDTDDVRISFLSYDAVTDSWNVLPNPPGDESWLQLTAAGEHLIAYPRSHETMSSGRVMAADPLPSDLLYRPSNQSWHALPADPHRPSYDRKLLPAGDRMILLAKDLVTNPGVDPPVVRIAALGVDEDPLTANWSLMSDGEFLWPDGYVSVGGLLVSPHLGSADGGETNNWGREYPNGGIIDPETGEWTALPSVPDHDSDAWGIGPESVTGQRTVVDEAWAVDVPTLGWTKVPQRAVTADGVEMPLPTTGHASALIETPEGPLAFVWGGTRWSDPDSFTSDYELLDAGWLWPVPTP